jgi:hypothetical protein
MLQQDTQLAAQSASTRSVNPSGSEGKFPAAVEGLGRINTMTYSEGCKNYLGRVIERSAKTMSVGTLVSNIRIAATASKTQLLDGPSSMVSAKEAFGEFAGNATYVKDKFISNSLVDAMSARNDPRIWLRSGDWNGWLGTFSTRNNTANPDGMGILMDELLHNKSVGGFRHPAYTSDLLTKFCFQ